MEQPLRTIVIRTTEEEYRVLVRRFGPDATQIDLIGRPLIGVNDFLGEYKPRLSPSETPPLIEDPNNDPTGQGRF